jgi:hypothetical protein
MIIPTGHTSEDSGDASLHRLHVACAKFRNLDAGILLQPVKDNLKDIYEKPIPLDSADAFYVLEDYFTALNDAMEVGVDQPAVESDTRTLLYLFEFNKITKMGGINNSYVTIELPGIKIPHVILTNMYEKPLKCSLISDNRT